MPSTETTSAIRAGEDTELTMSEPSRTRSRSATREVRKTGHGGPPARYRVRRDDPAWIGAAGCNPGEMG